MSRKSGVTHINGVKCSEVKKDQSGKKAFGVGTLSGNRFSRVI